MLVSACILARDAEKTIARCLSSLEGLADEVIVVDTGSRDQTIEICREYGARVVESPWQHDFSFHRNESIAHAQGTWVLVIDSDEWIAPTDASAIRAQLSAKDVPNLLLVKLVSFHGPQHQSSSHVLRWIRRSTGLRYVYPVHEQLDVLEEEAGLSDVVIHHDGYDSPEVVQTKLDRNIRLAMTMPEGHGHRSMQLMRSYAGKDNWDAVAVYAEEVYSNDDLRDEARFDGCLFSALAARQSTNPQPERVDFFLDKADEFVPGHPDIHYLRMIEHGSRYLTSLEESRPGGNQDWFLAGRFWPQERVVRQFLKQVCHLATLEAREPREGREQEHSEE